MDTDYMEYTEISEILKVLAHPIRLCIVKSLLDQGKSNVGNMYTCLHIPQSTVYQYLQKLKFTGIIEGHRNGIEIFYRLRDERIGKLVNLILELK